MLLWHNLSDKIFERKYAVLEQEISTTRREEECLSTRTVLRQSPLKTCFYKHTHTHTHTHTHILAKWADLIINEIRNINLCLQRTVRTQACTHAHTHARMHARTHTLSISGKIIIKQIQNGIGEYQHRNCVSNGNDEVPAAAAFDGDNDEDIDDVPAPVDGYDYDDDDDYDGSLQMGRQLTRLL